MPTAADLLKQGKHEELWNMCCGFLSLTIDQFMEIQERLLLEQIDLLSSSQLGQKLFKGRQPKTVEEFRQMVPLTTYKDYCPELLEKQEDTLPQKPQLWARSSGRTGEYHFKWVPLTPEYCRELSVALYGIGILSCCSGWNDVSKMSLKNKVLFSVAPRPYISGIFTELLSMQIPMDLLPPLEQAENVQFEERIKLGFQQALSQGLDYFFGLSLVLVNIGEKFKQSSQSMSIKPYLNKPGALLRLIRGKLKSILARRALLPKDIWSPKGIIGSGIDSWVYKSKIKEYWGRPPLDLYSCTEGGIIATQAWDYQAMTPIPNLNFLEFVSEDEYNKNILDRSYQPRTLLLNDLKENEIYEIVITNFHGGVMTRYRIGDMIRVTALNDKELGIALPQIAFERRVDDTIDFNVVRLTEKVIWEGLEKSGIGYTDWLAYREPGTQVLNLFIEPNDGHAVNEEELSQYLYDYILDVDDINPSNKQGILMDMLDFKVNVNVLKAGAFTNFTAQKQSEGADLAHIKPPHLNASDEILALFKNEQI